MRCAVGPALLSLIVLASCASFQKLSSEAQAAVDCVIDEVSISGREISVFVDFYGPTVVPNVSVFGPEVDFQDANEVLVIHSGERDSDGEFYFWGRTDMQLMRAIDARCAVTLLILIAGIFPPEFNDAS